ncbi:MAG TPA: copper homeostasis protein CutC [Pyrinomonadaceae bacterium]
MTQPILEVIACSVSDAIEAEKGGANRLEVVRDLRRGGLTPSWELVREIKSAVDLPLRVMLRESVGYETSGEDEIKKLCLAAEHFAALDVDGFVIGFLKQEQVDVELTHRVLACAPNVKATFHHAFEESKDRLEALKEIKGLSQVDRILSSGGRGALDEKVQRLGEYEEAASPQITIVAGGGVDSEAILRIGRATRIREFHIGRAARSLFQVEGQVQARLVSGLAQVLKKLQEQ